MEVRRKKCEWCEKTYAVMDSTSSNRSKYCSEECEVEYQKACEECSGWVDELSEAWAKYKSEYVPGEDEEKPYGIDTVVSCYPDNRRQYLAFKARYQKWKSNNCWKKSFWAWDEESGSSSFGDGGDGCVGGLVMIVLKGVGILVAVWIGWAVLKGVWNGIFGGGKDEVITEAAIMEKWEEHLEKRREAFDDGKPEKEIEAKGLRNYSWEEWQAKFKKEHEAAEKPKEDKKEVKGDAGDTVATKAKEIGNQALSAAKELGDKAKGLWQNITSKEEKDAEAEAKAKAEAEARTKMEAEARAKVEVEVRAKVEAEAKAEAEARAKAAAEAAAKAKAEAEARAKAEAEAKPKKDVAKVAAAETVGEQPNDTVRKKASADSKGIAIIVQGKGKTKDAALRYAIRQAVWKTVGTWVGSKSRMEEKRDEVKAQVMTITQDDVRKFEVLDTQQEGGSIVLKVKVSVSKKQIAPKFAKVFPDVFGND